MYLVRYGIIIHFSALTIDDTYPINHLLDNFHFFLLVFSTIIIAAAGYIINDYFDLKTDRINKPEKIVIGKYIKRRVAMVLHAALNFIGVLLGFYLAFKVNVWWLGFFHFFSALMLWFYSLFLKRKFLSGNLTIAFLAGMTPFLVGWYEIPHAFISFLQEKSITNALQKPMVYWVLVFSFFSFFATLIREIIKDLADLNGDKAINCKTVPIVIGIQKTKILSTVLYLILIIALLVLTLKFQNDIQAILYITIAVSIPLLISLVINLTAKKRKGFLLASSVLKLAMITAVLYTLMINV